MKLILKLKIKQEHNPPKIGEAEEEGLIATQEVEYDDVDIEKYGEIKLYQSLDGIMENLINEFIEVVVEKVI